MGGAILAVGVVVALLLQRSSEEPRQLIVRVEGQSLVPLTDLRLAEGESKRIFETAKVRVVWARGPRVAGTEELTIRAVAGTNADRLVPRSTRGQTRLAIAIPAARRAYVHFPRVVAVARLWHLDPGVLLGRVVAHELLHILLRDHDHATSGLMTAEIDPRGANPPRLTTTETEAIHQALSQLADARSQ
jgi:hypothetical protein